MATDMLGGDVAQIRQGATTYRALGDNLTATGGQVVATTDSVVSGLQQQLSTAQTTIVSTVEAVSGESRTARSGLHGIVWTGHNRAQVEEVGAELEARVTETTARIQELFATFRGELDRLGGQLTDVATQFNLVALSAGESASSLALAMDSQATQLDEVMNTGITRA